MSRSEPVWQIHLFSLTLFAVWEGRGKMKDNKNVTNDQDSEGKARPLSTFFLCQKPYTPALRDPSAAVHLFLAKKSSHCVLVRVYISLPPDSTGPLVNCFTKLWGGSKSIAKENTVDRKNSIHESTRRTAFLHPDTKNIPST